MTFEEMKGLCLSAYLADYIVLNPQPTAEQALCLSAYLADYIEDKTMEKAIELIFASAHTSRITSAKVSRFGRNN